LLFAPAEAKRGEIEIDIYVIAAKTLAATRRLAFSPAFFCRKQHLI
jgi:hypothetical protein